MGNVPSPLTIVRRATIKEDLVSARFAETSELTSQFYELVKTYIQDISQIISDIKEVDGDIDVKDVNTDIRLDSLEALLRTFPVNPLENITWPTPPTDGLIYDEDANYSDSLFNSFDQKLQSTLSNVSTLLNSSIENAILQREKERDILINQDAVNAKASEWADRGCELPGGGLFTSIGQVSVDYQNALLTKSRDIAVESRKLEISNMHKLIEEINKFEEIRMQYKSGYWQRRLDAAKALLDRANIVFSGQIEIIKNKALVYQAVCTAYGSHANALSEFAKVKYDSIKGAIEYATLKVNARVGEINADIKELEFIHGSAIEGAKTQASLAAQIMSSALAAVNTSASISSGDSVSIDGNISISETWDHNLTE